MDKARTVASGLGLSSDTVREPLVGPTSAPFTGLPIETVDRNVTVLSVLVDAIFVWLPLVATPAGMLAMTVPLVVMPVTVTV